MFGIRAGEFTGHKIGFSLPKQSRILLPGSIQVEWNVLRVRSLTAIFEGWQVLVCWVRLAFVASPLEDVQSSMGMKAPAFFADDCLFLGCCCMHEANCLVGTSLNLSQLRNTDSFHSAFWNHSEEYFYSSMSIATYPLWILSLKGKYKWRTMCLWFPMVASDERERSNQVENPPLRWGRFQCHIRKHSIQEGKSLLSLFSPIYRFDSDYSWRWSTIRSSTVHNIYYKV